MNGTLRFFLALLVGAGVGAGLGILVEVSLIRPLYSRPFYIVLLTLGLGYVLREVVQLLWDPIAYSMDVPPLFAQPGKAENLLAWFSGHNLTINIVGRHLSKLPPVHHRVGQSHAARFIPPHALQPPGDDHPRRRAGPQHGGGTWHQC